MQHSNLYQALLTAAVKPQLLLALISCKSIYKFTVKFLVLEWIVHICYKCCLCLLVVHGAVLLY